MSEPTEAPTQPIPIRKERTPAQLETLRLAREKAAKVRSMNAETRRKQGEVDRAAAEEVKRQKVEKLEREYAAIQQPKPVEEEPEAKVEEEEEEIEYVYKKKPVKKKRVVVVEKSDSEDELEIVIPKAKKPIDPKQERYKRMYNKMFDL
jgi:beta-galactosidase/beta-glucuronidase